MREYVRKDQPVVTFPFTFTSSDYLLITVKGVKTKYKLYFASSAWN